MDNTDEVDCVISTQWQSRVQKDISSVLGVAQNKVHVRTKRLGGAFGGKETSNVIPAVAAAVAAVKFNRPVRIVLERDEDMLHTGTRHPSQFHYKIGFNKDGKVIAYQSEFQSISKLLRKYIRIVKWKIAKIKNRIFSKKRIAIVKNAISQIGYLN